MKRKKNEEDGNQVFLALVFIISVLLLFIANCGLSPEERAVRCRKMLLNEEIASKRYQSLNLQFKQRYGRDIEISETLSPKTQLEYDIGQAEGELLEAIGHASACNRGG